MINLTFLRAQHPVHGLEFMDFQSHDFYKELHDIFSSVIKNRVLQELPYDINRCIEKYTGFSNIVFHLEDQGNLAIDSGYTSPGNLFNNDGIEHWLPKSQTTLYRWYKENKTSLFKGDIDFRTGKVSGDYATLEYNIYINRYLDDYLNKVKVTDDLAASLSCFLVHELGHCFSACFGIHRAMTEAIAIQSMVHWLSDSKYGQSTVAVIKDTLDMLEVDKSLIKDVEKLESQGLEAAVLYVTKLNNVQNQMNTRSLGVALMNSEVIADLYAIRMGCDKKMVAGLANFVPGWGVTVANYTLLFLMLTSTMLSVLAPLGPIGIAISFALGGSFTALIGLAGSLTSGIYNTDYRRMLNVMQEQIKRIKVAKNITPALRAEYLKRASESLEVIQKYKPMFEDTVVQRLVGFITDGHQFKYQQIEHYTQMIANNEMTLLNERVQQLLS